MENRVHRLQHLSAAELASMPKGGPKIEGLFEEMYGLLDEESDLLGIVLRDIQDRDFSFVLLTRKGQPEGLHCAIDLGTSYGKPELAEAALRESLDRHRRSGTVWG